MSDTVKVGQVWADNDKRSQGRTIRVDAVSDIHAICTPLTPIAGYERDFKPGKRTRIALRRFKPTSTGYRLLAESVEG